MRAPSMGHSVVIASHNLMRGTHIDALAAHHRGLRERTGLDVLCLQEARREPCGTLQVRRLARALGDWADVIEGDPVHGVALVYDRTRLRLVQHETFLLPRFERMNAFERRVLLDDRPAQIEALLAVFEAQDEQSFAVVDFHLDTVGGTPHRRAQVDAIARRLRADGLASRVVACGDTNAFAVASRWQPRTLADILAPLSALGMRDEGTAATHWFARQDEPGWLHYLVRSMARLGLEIPSRYDVICTDLPTLAHGRVETVESDHDLVWAELSLARSTETATA
jgi:endonuclease/exonuclease/phosphatase family metal-dependent hydrolase